jgi:protein-tyrosine-phosphatase
VPNIKNIDWNIPDPKSLEEEQFDEIRDMIKSKIISELLV